MTDRPITRIVTAEQALGICKAPVVGPDQRTLLDAPAPFTSTDAPTGPPHQPTLVTVHSALGFPPRDARILAPDQTTMVNGVPAPIRDEPATLRLTSSPRTPHLAALVALPPPPAIRRGQAIAFVALACVGSALVAGGVVHLIHQQRATAAPTQPSPTEPPTDAVLRARR